MQSSQRIHRVRNARAINLIGAHVEQRIMLRCQLAHRKALMRMQTRRSFLQRTRVTRSFEGRHKRRHKQHAIQMRLDKRALRNVQVPDMNGVKGAPQNANAVRLSIGCEMRKAGAERLQRAIHAGTSFI